MALERIGLGGVLTFDSSQANRSMGRARDHLGRFVSQARRAPSIFGRVGQAIQAMGRKFADVSRALGRGVSQLASAAQGAGMALLPLTAAVGLGTRQAASFEHQMSAVGAITNGSAEDMGRLTAAAREAGIQSAFSATQAGQAMEYMARSGANTSEIVDGLGGVTAAAAAEGIELAEASDIVAQATRIMGREWSQANNTADILVRTSQRSNTNVLQLGEAFRYGGQSARAAGLDMEETSGILGRLADSGLRGSVGGTSMANALSKLARPSREARRLLRRYNIQMTRTAGGGVDLANISQQLGTAISGVQDPLERTRIATEIFGQRGRRAFEALAQAGEENVDSLVGDLRRASEGEGAAAIAALRRLDNLQGAVTLLMSSLEGVAITIFGPMLGPIREMVVDFTSSLNSMLTAVGGIIGAGKDTQAQFIALNTLLTTTNSNQASVILGLVDAIRDIQAAINWLKGTFLDLKDKFEGTFGPDTIRTITRVAVVFSIVGAAIAPILVALGSLVVVIATVGGTVVSAIGGVISAVFWPLVVAIGVAYVAFMMIKREGESTGETLIRIWNAVKAGVMDLWNSALKPLYDGFVSVIIPVFQALAPIWREVVTEIKNEIALMAATFMSLFGETEVNWRQVGRVFAYVVGGMAMIIMVFIRGATVVIGGLMRFCQRLAVGIVNNIVQIFRGIWNMVMRLVGAISALWSGNIADGLAHLGNLLLDLVLEPIKMILRGFITLVDTFGGTSLISESAREWTRAVQQPVRAESGPTRTGNVVFDSLMGDAELPTAPATAAGPSRAQRDRDRLGREVAAQAAAAEGRRGAPAPVQANVTVEDQQEVNVNNEVCVDGRNLSVASQRHRTEIGERSGFRTTPWQRRVRMEQGATPASG
jgi:TP901 family phage tail tape measure protein